MKPVHWVASSKQDLSQFPDGVRREAAYCVYLAQKGDKSVNAVRVVGFDGSQAVEAVVSEGPGPSRVVYFARLKHAIYVIHACQRKPRSVTAFAQTDLDLVKRRLKVAKDHHQQINEKLSRKEKQHDKTA